MNFFKSQPYLLKNTIQHYEWGTRGKNAFIPKLLNIKAHKGKPYAELWMGAHPKSSSRIVVNRKDISLDYAIQRWPVETLGKKVSKRFLNTLPFLFKVLSVNEALSIQAHPNKRQAILLHKKDSFNYPDLNEKHEMAIVLDSLTALVGFKSFDQIISTLKKYVEIKQFIGRINLSEVQKRNSIKGIVTRMIMNSVSDVEGLSSTIILLNQRIGKKKYKTEIEKYFIKLHKKYKCDIGLLLIFFLNLVHLKRGEAIFTKPGVPHAYLKGNLLECMSNSDNVVRGGLTSKFKDIESLLNILTYDSTQPGILKGKKKRHSKLYNTDAKEFEIELFEAGKSELEFAKQSEPRIILVLEGEIKFNYELEGKQKTKLYSKGESILLPAILNQFKILPGKKSKFVQVSVPA